MIADIKQNAVTALANPLVTPAILPADIDAHQDDIQAETHDSKKW